MSTIRVQDLASAPSDAVRKADLIIDRGGWVIKDRYGIVPRPATALEIAEAETPAQLMGRLW